MSDTPPKAAPTAGDATTASPVDPNKNIKAEFDRKIGNLESTNAAILKQLESLTAATTKPRVPETPQSMPKKISVWEDEEAYARSIQAATEASIEAKLVASQQVQQKHQTILNNLYREWPELTSNDHELTTLAIKKYDEMAQDEKTSPSSYKTAVAEAAAELGIKPKSKRGSGTEDTFALSGSRGQSSSRSGGEESVHPLTEQFAELVGVDMSKVKARNQKRKNFSSWG